MSLPSSYSSILADLNRDVLRAQPTDALQFCANWFASRLEQERITFRIGTEEVSMRETTPPLSARSIPGDPRGGPPSSRKGSQPSTINQGYTFGGPPRNPSTGSAMEVETPFAEYTSPSSGGSAPSPFSRPSDRAGSAPPPPSGPRDPAPAPGRSSDAGIFAAGAGIGGSRSKGAPAPLDLGPRDKPAPALPNRDEDSSDEDVEDPRDNPNYNPHANSTNGGGSGTGIPVGYNLGRRTSVSAESLDPNAPTSHMPKTVIPKSASQRQRIEASIANNLLFRNLDEDQHKDVLNAMKEVTVNKGTEVIVQGAVGDFFYVVEEGTFEVWVRGPPTHTYTGPGQTTTIPGEEKQVATYGPGGSFGELALMYNAPRAATVVATSRATMWALDRVTFRSILMEHTSRKRKMYESFLGEVPILASLTPQERAKVADALEEKVYEEGEKVVVEGEVGKNFYIIESGKAEVSRRRRNSGSFDEEVLGALSKGDYFGELALLNSAPRAATVRAMPGQGRLRVATLGEKAFTRLLGPVIDILQRKAQNSYGPDASRPAIQGSNGAVDP
ncbi:cAMP-dependent protein kinase regulatory subunit, partial [Pseudohyphozyma bogoriensis]